jgi:hypothetical protein
MDFRLDEDIKALKNNVKDFIYNTVESEIS